MGLLGGVLLASPGSWSLVEVARVTTKPFIFDFFKDLKWLKIVLQICRCEPRAEKMVKKTVVRVMLPWVAI